MLIPILGIKGQKPITVSGDSLKFVKSSMPGLSVNIPEANYEKTLKTWIKTLESGTKSKVAKENNELFIFGANIKEISLTPVNIYSKIVTRDSMLQLSASFELGKDKYIEKAKSEADYAKVQNFLKQFAKNEYLEVAKERVSTEEKKLKDLEKDLASLEKEKARLQKSIQSNNTTITNEKDNIVLQNNDLKTVTASITDNNSQLTSMDDGAAKEERQKYIKELEKRKKKILSSIESSENKINSSNSATEKATGEIATNETMQVTAKEKITQQTVVLQKFTDKMEKIKLY